MLAEVLESPYSCFALVLTVDVGFEDLHPVSSL
jgi:hypothetical protein